MSYSKFRVNVLNFLLPWQQGLPWQWHR